MPRKPKVLYTVQQCEAMGYKALHKLLVEVLARECRVIRWFNKTAQFDLLPALAAMKNLVAKPGGRTDLNPLDGETPNWEMECELLGISSAMVRKWKHRTSSETDIRHLVGEVPRTPTRNGDWQGKYLTAMKHLKTIVVLIEEGKFEKAEDTAYAIAEYHQF